MSTQTVVDVVISGSTTTVVDKRIDGVTTVAGAPPVTNVSGQVPDLGVNTDILATEGDILSLTNDVANLRANLIVTGTTLTDEIGVLSGHVISTGNNLEFQISTLSGNLIASGNNLDSLRDILSGNLVATGSNLKASITGITGDVDTLTTNLISTGDNLQTQILNSGDILDDLSGNLITTGQTLTSNLISTGSLIQPQIDGIESDLITTGQTLLTTGSNLQALIVEDINNLIDTGNNLEPRIVANLTSISSLQTETGLLGAATGELQEYKFNKSGGVISGVILPHSSGALDFGSESLPFRTGFFNDIKVSANTLFIGDVPIHTSNGGIDFSNATGVTVFEDVSIRNLTVTGTETIIDVEHLAVKDNIIIINSGETDAGIAVGSGGLVIDRGTLPDADLLFNENNDRFEFNFPLAVNNNVVVTKNETGVYADASNLQQTGVTLQTQITNNDADITALNTATGELKTQSNTNDSNLITTGQFLTDKIAVVSGIAGGSTFDELSGDLITTGQTLTSEISIVSGLIGQEASDIDGLSGNLITTGQSLTNTIISTGSLLDELSGNLNTTGVTLQNQITSNDSDISTLTSNLRSTGVTLQTQITSNDLDIAVLTNLLIETGFAVMDTSGNADTISGNLISTGQYLTNEITTVSGMTTGGVAADIISGNLITTGQTLTSDIGVVSGLTVTNTNNLISTGNNLQGQITSNDGQIAGIIGDLVNTGQTLTTNINTVSSNLITTGQNLSNDIATVSGIAGGQDFDTLSGNLITTGQTLTSEIAIVSGLAGGEDFNTLSGNLITTGQYLTEEIAIVSGLTTGSSSDPALSGKVDTLSGNLITTGQTLTTNINTVSSNLIATGKTLTDNVNTVSSNLVSTGSRVDDISGNLITTGQTLQTQITSNDSDISTLTSNLGVTGQTLQTQITSNDSDISTITSNLATTGQTLQTQITSNDSDISTLTSNLVTTGQTLTSEIAIVSGIAENASDEALSGKVDTLSGNLITTGQTLQTQITSNDSDITSLTSNLVSTGQTLTTDITTVSGLIVDNDGDITALKTATGVLKTSTDSNTANLITTGQTLQTQITSNDGDISTLTNNLGTTGQTLQTQITSNDSDISTLTSNLITTGQTLTTDIGAVSGLITDNDADITALKSATGVLKTSTDTNTTNLITTGQTLQTQITSNDGDITTLTSNLVTTGQTLQAQITSNDSDISTLTTNLGTTGQTLQTQITSNDSNITSLTSNLITTGQTLTTDINTVSGLITDNDADITALKTATGVLKTSSDNNTANLITTGQTLQTQITSNDGDITTLTSNLVTTGQTLTTNINTVSTNLVSTGKVIDDVSGNLITTGQTLQTQITSNDGDITTLTSNLVTTGQTLTTNINTVSTNLGTSGQTLQTQITSNDSDISTLTSNLGTTGQTLQTQITSNDSDIASLTTNLGTTGQTLQTQITSNDSDISTLDSTTVKLTTNQSIAGNKIFTNDVTINNLTVTGTEVVVDVENLAVKDNIIEINSGESSAGISRISGGIVIDRGTATNANILYNDANDRFELNFPLAVEGEVVASASNLITTGQTLTTNINTVSTNLGTSGQTLQTQITSNDSDISTLTANLGTTGQTLQTQITSNDSDISTLTTNLGTTGQTLQTQITSNDSDISTLTSNLVTTGQTLQTQITSNDSDISTLTTNLGTTGQTLQTQITSNDSDISTLTSNLVSTGSVVDDVSGNLITTGQTLQTQITSNDSDITTLTSNLVTTGQTLTTNINTVSTNLISTGKVVDDISGNLITTGQTLQTQITSNDTDITNLSSNLVTTGQTLTTNINTVATNLVTTGQTLTSEIATVSGLIPATVIDGGGTANTVPLWSDANTIGDSVISQSSSKIGIGIASPSNILHVKHADPGIRLEDSSPDGLYGLLDAGGGDFIISADGGAGSANSFISFRVDGTAVGSEKMRITSAGSVGIGTNSPSKLLELTGGGLRLPNGNSIDWNNENTRILGSHNSNKIQFDVGGVSNVLYLSNGSVGIGTNAPSRKFMIFGGSARMGIKNTTEGVVLGLLSDDAGYLHLNNGSGTNTIQLRGDTVSYFNAGNVGIGTASPSAKLHVNGGSKFLGGGDWTNIERVTTTEGYYSLYVTNTGTNANQAIARFSHSAAAGSAGSGAETAVIARDKSYFYSKVGIGTNNPGYKLDVNGTAHITTTQDSVAPLTLKSTYNGSTAGPLLDLYRKSGTPADGDNLGTITFTADTNVGSINEFARIESTALDVTDTTEDGALKLAVVTAGTLRSRIYMDSTETVFNDASQDFDFRVESDNSSHALFVQGSSGNVGIGTNNPSNLLHLSSSAPAIRFKDTDNTDNAFSIIEDSNGNLKLRADASNVSANTELGLEVDGSRVMTLAGASVGIGTDAPSAKLDVYSSSTALRISASGGTSPQLELSSVGAVNWKLRANISSSDFRITRDSTDYLTILSGGNVGIGGIDPDQKLEVWGAIKSAGPYGFYAGRAVGTWSSFGTGVPTILLRGDSDNSRAGAIHFQEFDGNTTSAIYSTDGTDGYGFVMAAYQGDMKFATGSLQGYKMVILSGGSVGIGTNAPAGLLSLAKGTRTLDFKLETSPATGDMGVQIRAGSGDYIGLAAGGGTGVGLVVDSANQAGFGTGTFGSNNVLTITNVGNNAAYSAIALGTATTGHGNSEGYWIGMLENGQAYLWNYENQHILFGANNAERMRIRSDGNVGIGTNAPAYLLDLYKSSGTNQDVFAVRGATSAFLVQCSDLAAANPVWNLRTFSGEDLAFKSGNSETVRVKANGNVGIGTNAPAHKFEVYGGGGGTFGAITNRQSANANTDGIATVSYDSGNQSLRLWVDANGHRYLNAGTTAVISFTTTAVNIRKATTFSSGRATFSGTAGADGVVLAGGESTSLSSRLFFDNGTAGQAVTILNNSGGMEFRTAGTPGSSSGVVKMYLNSAGNLGIGTGNPPHKLSIYGTGAGKATVQIEGEGGADPYINFLVNNTTHWAVGADDSASDSFKISQHSALGTNDRITIASGGAITFNNAFTFPTSDGSAGQTLQTDGSGNVTWSSAGTGTISGSGTDNYIPRFNGTTALENSAIYDNGSSRISLGTVNTSPWQALHVQSTGSQFSDGASGNNNYNVVVLDQNAYTSNYGGGILFGGKYNNAGNITTLAMVSASKVNGDGNFGGKVHIGGREHGTSNVPKVLTVTHASVGIGTVNPAALLHVDGQAIIDALHFDSLSSHFIKNDGNLLRIAGDNGVKFQSYDGGWQTRMTIVDDGNVGIGTISPDNPLEVFGADSGIKISSASNNRPHLRLECGTAEKLRLSANTVYGAIGDSSDTNRYMAFKDGNIGIATVTPGVKLHVAGQGLFANNGSNIILANSWSSGNTDVLFGGSGVSTGSATNTAARIRCLATAPGGAATGSLTFTVNSGDTFVDALYIKENGKVGIGTNAPDSKLEIVGGGWNSSLKIKSAGSETGIQFEDSAGNTDGYIYAIDGNVGFLDAGGSWMVQCKNDDYIRFAVTSNTEHMRIKSDGNVGIGTNNPVQRLHLQSPQCIVRVVSTTANSNSSIWFNSNVGGTNADRWEIGTNISAGSSLEIYDRLNGASRMVVKNDGNVGIGTNSSNAHLKVQSASGADVLVRINTGGTETDSRLMLGEADAYGMTFEYDGVSNIGYLGMNDNVQPTGSWSKRIQMSRAGTEVAFMAGNVGIGTATPLDKLDVYGTGAIFRNLSDNADSVQIVRGTNHTASPDAKFYIYDNSSADWAAKINLDGASYGLDITGGASYFLLCREANGTSLLEVHNGRMVVNEGGRDMDFRVEGDTDDYLLFTEAGTDRVAISTTAPAAKLHVEGDFKVGTTNNGNWMGYKDVSLNGNTYTTALTINLNNHTGCYVKLFLSGDWSSHSAVAFVGEYFIQNGSDGYAEPGTVISEFDNTNTDSIESKIVDPSSDTFTIQLKLSTAANGTLGGKLSYHVMGMATAVS